MNRYTVDTVVRLIGHALKNEVADNYRDEKLSEETFKKLIKFAHAHRMLPMAADVLLKSGAVEHIPEIGSFLRKKQFEDVLRSQKRDYELQRMGQLFSELKIKFIPLKGSVVKALYPEPWMRTSCDIDVLIHKEDLERATCALTERFGFKRFAETFHDISFNADSGVHIELHYTLVEDDMKSVAKTYLEEVWERSAPITDGGFEYKMSDEMFLFYHVVHMAKHVTLGGCGIRPFADLFLLRQTMDFNGEGFKEMLEKAEFKIFFETAVSLCDVWFSEGQRTELTEELERYVLSGGVFGTTQNSLAVKRGEGESNTRHFKKLIFLPREQLEKVYPELKKHRWMFPFYQVRRWFRMFDSKKRKRYVSAINVGNNLSDEHINKVSKLMKELELK
ncbi:MAG: nucleotidyltransferase family protein [Clostridia bacterium]|nr:nucleotidyltransferase family protein [Clostridia bacterium]